MNIIKYTATPTRHTYVGCVWWCVRCVWLCGHVWWVWLWVIVGMVAV